MIIRSVGIVALMSIVSKIDNKHFHAGRFVASPPCKLFPSSTNYILIQADCYIYIIMCLYTIITFILWVLLIYSFIKHYTIIIQCQPYNLVIHRHSRSFLFWYYNDCFYDSSCCILLIWYYRNSSMCVINMIKDTCWLWLELAGLKQTWR